MNIVLFTAEELQHPLARQDARIKHIERILGMQPGDQFDIGVLNGPRGKATLKRQTANTVELDYSLEKSIPDCHPLCLLTGYNRPQTMRRILREATALGVAWIWVVQTAKGEKSYRHSRLWQDKQYQNYLIQGASQAFTTRIPAVKRFASLAESLASLAADTDRIAMDNYEAQLNLSQYKPRFKQAVLAFGAERGWSSPERDLLRDNHFTLANLGTRVLRSDTACIAAITLLLSRMGLI